MQFIQNRMRSHSRIDKGCKSSDPSGQKSCFSKTKYQRGEITRSGNSLNAFATVLKYSVPAETFVFTLADNGSGRFSELVGIRTYDIACGNGYREIWSSRRTLRTLPTSFGKTIFMHRIVTPDTCSVARETDKLFTRRSGKKGKQTKEAHNI